MRKEYDFSKMKGRRNPYVASKYVKCRGCGKKIRIFHHLLTYCPACSVLDQRLIHERIPPQGKKYFWSWIRKHGRRCHYSGMTLETDDYASAWYLVFSQLVPGDKTRMVPASALVNDIKFTLIPKDFKYYVLALDDYRQKHLKVKKRPLVHWCLLKPVGDEVCPVCGAPKLKRQKLCARCSGLLHRMQRARFTRQAIEGVWTYLHHYGFVDYYTGMDLDTDDPKSPWYLVFDHWSPRDPRKIVVTLALVNRMKGDLTEKEFWYFIHQLAQHFRRGTPVRKRKLKFWSRPYR